MNDLTKKKYLIFLLTIVLFMTIGYALLSSSVTINGTSDITGNTWDVHFENIVEDLYSWAYADADQSIVNNTTVNFSLTLKKPGDEYSFNVDVVNKGSLDAMVESIVKSPLPSNLENAIEYKVTYYDDVEIKKNDILVKSSGLEKIKVYIRFRKNIEASDLPSSQVDLNLSFSINYVQANNSAQEINMRGLSSFITKAKAGNVTSSDLGTVFRVDMGDTFGSVSYRVSNVSSPSECSNANFSGTACGVVLESVMSIGNYKMNNTSTNIGSWPASNLRNFLNGDFFNSLPQLLQDSIITTQSVSTHGRDDSGTGPNGTFICNDKIYLPDFKEVYGDVYSYFLAANYERQLDYYSNLGVTLNFCDDAIKKEAWGDSYFMPVVWYLRSAYFLQEFIFYSVDRDGSFSTSDASSSCAVIPAFRIA